MQINEQRWQAVLGRDGASDGDFVYAVRSTGIYCRPSCPSRRPRREGVCFFDGPDAAEHAGFRACLRCRPRGGEHPQAALVRQVCAAIDAADAMPSLADLSAQVFISPFHLQRTFRTVMGVTPRQYAEHVRLQRLKQALKGDPNVAYALHSAGFSSASSLYAQADGQLGMTPATYGRGGAGAHIHYTTVPCEFGVLLVAGTERGLCAVYLGDNQATLLDDLRQEYPAAELEHGGEHLQAWVETILAYIEGQQEHLDLPLDLRGSAFQQQVWAALRAVPYGSTTSYGAIARQLGKSAVAARAVGQACGSNPVALVIPCHRAVASDGGLQGYRWGVKRKQQLLQHEARHGTSSATADDQS